MLKKFVIFGLLSSMVLYSISINANEYNGISEEESLYNEEYEYVEENTNCDEEYEDNEEAIVNEENIEEDIEETEEDIEEEIIEEDIESPELFESIYIDGYLVEIGCVLNESEWIRADEDIPSNLCIQEMIKYNNEHGYIGEQWIYYNVSPQCGVLLDVCTEYLDENGNDLSCEYNGTYQGNTYNRRLFIGYKGE